ncbi:alanine--tRNA ligase [Bacteriovorax sp. BSW11_IV]|uniref:alanine--tRNA ligase n=1 Tax=Bacteriovorax sp. BSW11_IV TaxID=1353529 RepID=UPI00038A2FF9|nr:alanine--tRNA ligase [Bacteriovorax sp. BSW11_IV]EQC49581.1 alanine--tRNA ligase [Bacteriovorax sp. BSW11_IV]
MRKVEKAMKKMSSLEIRNKFLEYFEKNDHLKIGAASIVPQNDPTLLFINSGMAPLKSYFLGKETPPSPRLANFQPCIRTKDIDDVGDRHHLTIFEMMGSWSIGDYYKDRACELAYNLLVGEMGFPAEKLYFTVYGGNEKLGIKPDFESVEAWKKCGVPEDHIVMLGDDNFWGPAGDTGPCGPCTEVFFDCGEQYGPTYKPGGHFDDVSRYIEIWNAGVFMELNKQKDGTFEPLPLKSVDTGSGLERLAMVINGHDSVYDTDLLKPLVDMFGEMIGGSKNENDMRKVRMLSDHTRAATCILGEGVMPGNEGQGYIPRRLIRKCIAALISKKVKNIDFTPMVDKTIEILGDFYPQMKAAREAIIYNMQTEVSEFTPIVEKGLSMIDEIVAKAPAKIFSGEEAFDLVSTHGLPLEVIKSHLADLGLSLDEEKYEKCWEEHRKASRVISRKGGLSDDQEKIEAIFTEGEATVFKGYEALNHASIVNKIVKGTDVVEFVSKGDEFSFTTTETSFYAESGGQVGDKGMVVAPAGKAEIVDTVKVKDKHVHIAKVIEGEIKSSDKVELKVSENERQSTKRHHSATHLLHSALHQVLGKHATQKGSLVKSDRLRFDFQHPQAVTKEELEEVEKLVNKWIMENAKGSVKLCGYEEAIESGAMALFGEKYDSKVRVISFGSESVELCGGTHVEATGDIGLFLIASETSVAKGIRRIEAVVGAHAVELMQQRNRELNAAANELKVKTSDIVARIQEMRKQASAKKKEAPAVNASSAQFVKEVKKELHGVSFFAGEMQVEPSTLKELGDQMIDKAESKIVCLLGKDDKSIKAFVWVHKDIAGKVKAGDILKQILAPVEGRGGGKPNFAQGGAPSLEGMDKIFGAIESL